MSPEQRPRSVAGAASSVSTATLVSRVLGVAREAVMARYFGAGLFTDAFNVAYRIPNLLRDLFAEGALSAAFVPTFIRILREEGKESAWRLANLVVNALVVVLGVVTVVIAVFAKGFVYMLAAQFAQQPEKLALTVEMTRIMSPFLLFVALAAVAMGMLNAFGSFFVPAVSPSAFNVASILAGIFLSPVMPRFGLDPIVSMAIGALVGGAGQLLVQLPSAQRLGYRYRPILDLADPKLRAIGKLMLPALVGLSATQINITVDNQLASRYGDGPISWLNYAFRVMQLPIGLFGAAVATATLASVSHHAAANATEKLSATVASSLRLAACLTFPATVGLIIFREEIVALLYQRGAFLRSDTRETSSLLFFYSLALFAYSAVKILVPTFYALGDTRTPVRTSVASVAAKIAINFALILPLGFRGLALATAAAAWLNFGLLLRSLNRKTQSRWGRAELLVYARIAGVSAAMGVLSYAVFQAARAILPIHGTVTLAADLGVAIAVGMLVTLPLLRMAQVAEANELMLLAARVLRRRR
jgi:putative peptidoglycan lipid II flippase